MQQTYVTSSAPQTSGAAGKKLSWSATRLWLSFAGEYSLVSTPNVIHSCIFVLLVQGMGKRIFLLGKNMTSLRVGVDLILHSVKVTLFCSTCSGTMLKKLGLSRKWGRWDEAIKLRGKGNFHVLKQTYLTPNTIFVLPLGIIMTRHFSSGLMRKTTPG